MNRFLAFALAITVSLIASPLVADEGKRTLKQVYEDGVKHYQSADYASALKEFETYLKHQPAHPYARSYAAKCRQKIREGVKPVQTLEPQLMGLMIPEINFENTELGMAMEFLTQKSEELSNGKVVANFIFKGDESLKSSKTVTLKLRNAPFLDVVRYLGQLTQTRFTYEQFAIVGTPLGGTTTTPATPAPATGTTATSPASTFDSKTTTPIAPANSDPFGKR